jgi:hypothetical protein
VLANLPAEDFEDTSAEVRPEVEALFDREKLKAITNLDFMKIVSNKYARREIIARLLSDKKN